MKKFTLSDMPVGPDHPMDDKIEWSKWLYREFGPELLSDNIIRTLLGRYERAISQSWQAMKETRVVSECTRCALEDGGSCCGSGIENKFDVVNLLINRLMGVEIPEIPHDPTGCLFLGEKGCLIKARHVICVNFMCKRLYSVLSDQEVKKVQAAMEQETEAAFILEEYLKSWLAKNG